MLPSILLSLALVLSGLTPATALAGRPAVSADGVATDGVIGADGSVGSDASDEVTVTEVPLEVTDVPVAADQVAGAPDSSSPGGSVDTVTAAADEPLVADTADGGRVVSDVLETDGFQTLGVTWPDSADADGLDVQVRTRDDRGVWSDWHALEAADDGPDAGTPDAEREVRGGTDPLWVGEADAVQISFADGEAAPSDLSLTLVDVPEQSTVDAANALATTGATVVSAAMVSTATDAPTIITREQWGARPQVCTPNVASKLVGAVVHHTAGSNSYSTVAQAMQQIRGDQAYHIDGRGWCDIGYNFVVDKWGNIYEGRDDSLIKPVVGVHAGGFNTGTLGVSMLGTYDSAPPAATVRAVAQIIGWRLGYYGVNPQGSMVYHTYGGENSRYTEADVALPRVFGHRDVAYTACPGNGGYAALGSIRSQAASFGFDLRFQYATPVVKALYWDFLRRQPDQTGMGYWSNEFAAGRGGAPLVAGLTNSDEYVNRRILQAYEQTLGREPEPGGQEFWFAEIRAGRATVDDVTRRFLSTDEFRDKSGGTDAGLVRRLFETVLGRTASSGEVSYWADRIGEIGREKAIDDIWFSTEAAERRAAAYYLTFLKRKAEPAGQQFWGQVLLRDGEGAVRAGIAGSDEYAAKAQERYPS
ncbi:DUF4214 domain-containing protein [Actinotalea sp. M2MS4P-6]|uniref:DUF4214 domain-containing protein n=1 Tax=Actinotalea sp. M2MS4P-6 TaxID=2983762 RepID=UPI0021E46D3B|nr:DUF4214 domain-containing protein [Actinotalea sp. M2MS4P-6]MCV2395835.1 DUF4214 domain-containing protein [Actinotalea sp. M2MS4P-6]